MIVFHLRKKLEEIIRHNQMCSWRCPCLSGARSGAIHLFATSCAMPGAFGFVEIKQGGEVYDSFQPRQKIRGKNTQQSDRLLAAPWVLWEGIRHRHLLPMGQE
jgi:hypothetical protein